MPLDAKAAIGVDVGGTRMRVARINAAGTIEDFHTEDVDRTRRAFVAQMGRMVSAVMTDAVKAIGIGVPGRVDRAGKILSAGYLDVAGLDLATEIANPLGILCRVENDAAMALFAEVHGMEHGVQAIMTIGTGIGGAVMENGEIWRGGGLAGQFGHIPVAADGPECKCGRRGCVETLGSGTALQRLMSETRHLPSRDVLQLLSAAQAGNHIADTLLRQWAQPVERALQAIVAVLNPDRIFLGGGLGAPMAASLQRLAKPDSWFDIPFAPAVHGDDAGVIGAGLCALHKVRSL